MRAIKTNRKAPGGWRATQGGNPVAGLKILYSSSRWMQILNSRAIRAMKQVLSKLGIGIEKRREK
jgi:hypothetical protein